MHWVVARGVQGHASLILVSHDCSDGVMFLSSSQYVNGPPKISFQHWAKTLFFFFKAINSKPRAKKYCFLETYSVVVYRQLLWGLFLDASLGLVLASDIMVLAQLLLHTPMFVFSPIDDAEPFCLFSSWAQCWGSWSPQYDAFVLQFIEVEMSYWFKHCFQFVTRSLHRHSESWSCLGLPDLQAWSGLSPGGLGCHVIVFCCVFTLFWCPPVSRSPAYVSSPQ